MVSLEMTGIESVKDEDEEVDSLGVSEDVESRSKHKCTIES